MLIIKGLLGGVFQVAVLALFLIVPAGLVPGGTWLWERALIFLAVYGVILEIVIVAFAVKAPDSLRARLEIRTSGGQSSGERMVNGLLIPVLGAAMAFIPVDVFYLKLMSTPPFAVSVAGGVLILVGFAIVAAAIYQNSFAVPRVEDQSERGQTLVDTGVYGVVRHPLYAGILPYMVGIALWLESYAGLIVLAAPVALLVVRILVEERTLRQTLPGYTDYTKRVRYRLVPFVW